MSESPFRSTEQATLHIGDHEIPVTGLQWMPDPIRADERDAANYVAFRAGSLPQVSVTFSMPTRDYAHALAAATLRAFRIKPRDLGIDLRCACHTLPNPAARDYRRRTKHRNRRRR